jgi:hypothetical protein
MSDVYQSLAHSKWDFKYHVVFVSIPNGDGKRSSGISAVNWDRFSMRSRNRRNARSWRGT